MGLQLRLLSSCDPTSKGQGVAQLFGRGSEHCAGQHATLLTVTFEEPKDTLSRWVVLAGGQGVALAILHAASLQWYHHGVHTEQVGRAVAVAVGLRSLLRCAGVVQL